MPRPVDKKSLIELSKINFDKLIKIASSIPENAVADLNGRDRNVADVLTHLHEWHLLMLRWYKEGMEDGKSVTFEGSYTFKTLPEFNRKLWEKNKLIKYSDAFKLIKDSYNKVMKLIEKHTDDELFTKKKYKWTGTTSLGAYLISATSSHYDWGIKTLKPLIKK